jgi:6-phosphofructokinase 1
LIVIGGNDSQAGAHALAGHGVVGVASTIDNDLLGCDVTIGATTALDVALEAPPRTPLSEVADRLKPLDPSLFELARVLAR